MPGVKVFRAMTFSTEILNQAPATLNSFSEVVEHEPSSGWPNTDKHHAIPPGLGQRETQPGSTAKQATKATGACLSGSPPSVIYFL
jgi:hypothetical protein